jgi:hypothetical protein
MEKKVNLNADYETLTYLWPYHPAYSLESIESEVMSILKCLHMQTLSRRKITQVTWRRKVKLPSAAKLLPERSCLGHSKRIANGLQNV